MNNVFSWCSGEAASTAVDHTFEQERRLRAIQISGEDICDFYKANEGPAPHLRKCRFCIYGKFYATDIECENGLCKFRPG